MLVFPHQDGVACGLALGEGVSLFYTSAIISNPDIWSRGEWMSCKCWCFPHRMAGVVALGEPGGAWASGIRPCWVMHCTQPGYTLHIISQQSSYIAHHCTQLSNEHAFSTKNVYTGHLNIIRHYCTYQKYVNIIRLHCTRIGAHLVYCRLHWPSTVL